MPLGWPVRGQPQANKYSITDTHTLQRQAPADVGVDKRHPTDQPRKYTEPDTICNLCSAKPSSHGPCLQSQEGLACITWDAADYKGPGTPPPLICYRQK